MGLERTHRKENEEKQRAFIIYNIIISSLQLRRVPV